MKIPKNVIQKIRAVHPWYNPIEDTKGYWILSNYPELGLIIEYKPNAACVFILNLTFFEFFDTPLICRYFKKNLLHPKALFFITSNKIYLKPIGKYTDEELVEMFTYLVEQTNIVLEKIRNSIKV